MAVTKHSHALYRAGRYTTHTVFFGVDRTRSLPPCLAMMLRVTHNPSPVPFCNLVPENGSSISAIWRSGNPGPSFATVILTPRPPVACHERTQRVRTMMRDVSGECSTAFVNRFSTACRSSSRKPRMRPVDSSCASSESWRRRNWCPHDAIAASTSSRTSIGSSAEDGVYSETSWRAILARRFPSFSAMARNLIVS